MAISDIKQSIKEHYGKIAATSGSCCGPNCGCSSESDKDVLSVMMSDEYTNVDEQIVAAADLGLGCGTPTAFADLKPGMTVLDLGSGAGIDVFIAAKAVAPTGKAIGIDMTDEMLKRARANKIKLGISNAEFWKGEIENMPVESGTIDRIISNCVINLTPDKRKVLSEMYRVLKPGGKFTVSDIVSIGDIPNDIRRNAELWAGCIAGALDKEEFLRITRDAGFNNLMISAEKPYHLEGNTSFGLASITLTATK
ncbi:MAG TPA: arsenite S-adenosylmethyltransferase [Bacteroidetes bacterium]|jgi:arsenite methyltransferase|nr:arsenite S-adenosylmethyltransferase [Bacteroidota bacterium]